MLWKRVLTAVIGIPVILAAVYYGGYLLLSLVLITGLFAMDELFRVFSKMGLECCRSLGFIGAVSFILTGYFFDLETMVPIIILVIFINLLYYVLKFPQVKLSMVGLTLFSSLYIGLFLSFAILIRNLPNGFLFLILVFILTWAEDVGAYLLGRLVGKNKLFKALSPNKTKEGAAGGIILPVIASLLFFFFFPDEIKGNLFSIIVLGAAAGIVGQLGDLAASAVKRQGDIKDFGNVLPGHGGVMDRFDSFLLVVPMVYYYLTVFIID